MSNQYLSDFQIIGSSIKSLKIENDFIGLSNDSNIERTLDVSHSVASIETINNGESFLGTILLNIKTSASLDKKKYTVDLLIEGCFNAPAKVGENSFNGMLQVNGVTSLYSIARGFIQSTTSQTLVSGSILLPMFNVAAYSKNLDNQTS